MQTATIVALVVSLVYCIGAAVETYRGVDAQSGIALVLGVLMLLVLPYTVECLIVGGCTWYAWVIPGFMILSVGVGVVSALGGLVKRQEQPPTENKNV